MIGIIWFTQVEKLSYTTSIYTIVIIFTTVGYGVEGGLKDKTYIFLTFYSILSVSIVGASFSTLLDKFIYEMFQERKQLVFLRDDSESEDNISEETISVQAMNMTQSCLAATRQRMRTIQFQFMLWLAWLAAGSQLIAWEEGWTWWQGIYFGIVSGSTIGFGDFSPTTELGKLTVVFWLPVLVVHTMYIFSTIFYIAIIQLVDEQEVEMLRFQEKLEDYLNEDNFVKRIEQLDVNEDGVLTKMEFVLNCVINEYGVPANKLKMMREQFEKFDESEDDCVTIEAVQSYLQNQKLKRRNSRRLSKLSAGSRLSPRLSPQLAAKIHPPSPQITGAIRMINDPRRRDWNAGSEQTVV